VAARLVLLLALAGASSGDEEPGAMPPRPSDRPPGDVLPAAVPSDRGPLPGRADAREAIARGIGVLMALQRPDGGFGRPRPLRSGLVAERGSHDSWRRATSGLVVLAWLDALEADPPLPGLEAGALADATDHAVAFLAAPAGDGPTHNAWGEVYGLAACVRAAGAPRYAESVLGGSLRARARAHVDALVARQTDSGGWGYRDFDRGADHATRATSFVTAAAVGALLDAERAGLGVPPGVLERAREALLAARLPTGAFTYAIEQVPSAIGRGALDEVPGALGRIASCTDALARLGAPTDPVFALDALLEHHRFLDVARWRPEPHEAYYGNSGYVVLFAHYYAARLVARLPPAARARYDRRLAAEVLLGRDDDGGAWDFPFDGYAREYGTAFTVLALQALEPGLP